MKITKSEDGQLVSKGFKNFWKSLFMLGVFGVVGYFAFKSSVFTPVSESQSDENCVIKGNINYQGEKIYEVPGDKFYNLTNIDPSKGERYFCSEIQAQNAGWRPAPR